MNKFQLMVAIALTMCFISCSQQADTATGKQAATDSTMIETAADDNAETAELILTGNGIEGVLGLGTALDQLPAQVDGLYDQVVCMVLPHQPLQRHGVPHDDTVVIRADSLDGLLHVLVGDNLFRPTVVID